MNEAPFSANVRVCDATGYVWQFTLRETESPAFVERVGNFRSWLIDNGYTPMNGYNISTPPVADKEPEAPPEYDPVIVQADPEEAELDELVDELAPDVRREPTEPGEQGTEVIYKVETEPKPEGRCNVLLYGYWNDQPAKYPTLKIYNWTVDSLIKLFLWEQSAFETAHVYEGKWNVTYELSDKKTSKGNYYRNVVAVAKV